VPEEGPARRLPDHRRAPDDQRRRAHSVDSSDNAFQQAAIGAFRDGFGKAAPVLLDRS